MYTVAEARKLAADAVKAYYVKRCAIHIVEGEDMPKIGISRHTRWWLHYRNEKGEIVRMVKLSYLGVQDCIVDVLLGRKVIRDYIIDLLMGEGDETRY